MTGKAVRMLEALLPDAPQTLSSRLHDRAFPCALVRHAKGLAFITAVKSGFFCGAHAGAGVMIVRLPDGRWSGPAAFRVGGLGFGFQFGVSVVDVLLILNTEFQVRAFTSKTTVQLTGDVQLTVGPVGRDAQALIGGGQKGVTGAYAYSFSQGLYIGASVEGGCMRPNRAENFVFYGGEITPADIFAGNVHPKTESGVEIVTRLHATLTKVIATAHTEEAEAEKAKLGVSEQAKN